MLTTKEEEAEGASDVEAAQQSDSHSQEGSQTLRATSDVKQAIAEQIVAVLKETVDSEQLHSSGDKPQDLDSIAMIITGKPGTTISLPHIKKNIASIKERLFYFDVKSMVQQLAFIKSMQDLFRRYPLEDSEEEMPEPMNEPIPALLAEHALLFTLPKNSAASTTEPKSSHEDSSQATSNPERTQPAVPHSADCRSAGVVSGFEAGANSNLNVEMHEWKWNRNGLPPKIMCNPEVVEEDKNKIILLLNGKMFTVEKSGASTISSRAVTCHVCSQIFKFSQLRYHAYCSRKCLTAYQAHA